MERVVVCVSGIPRGGVGPQQNANFNIERNIALLKRAFPGAEFVFSTWHQHINDDLKSIVSGAGRLLSFEEPESHYHSYFDIDPDYVVSDKMREVQQKYSTKHNLKERTRHQAKQIVAHANTIDSHVPKRFDVVVRARWDTFVSPYADMKPYVDWVRENKHPIGFAHLKPFETFGTAVELPPEHESRDKFLFDSLIIHHRSNFDPVKVRELYAEKRLCPAEFGWYQTMSLPDNQHRCISGLANADRCVMPQFIEEANKCVL